MSGLVYSSALMWAVRQADSHSSYNVDGSSGTDSPAPMSWNVFSNVLVEYIEEIGQDKNPAIYLLSALISRLPCPSIMPWARGLC